MCFDLYFQDAQAIQHALASSNDIQIVDFLLYQTFLKEIKTTKPNPFFKQLLSHLMRHNYNLEQMIAAFDYTLRDIKALTTSTPVASEIITVLSL